MDTCLNLYYLKEGEDHIFPPLPPLIPAFYYYVNQFLDSFTAYQSKTSISGRGVTVFRIKSPNKALRCLFGKFFQLLIPPFMLNLILLLLFPSFSKVKYNHTNHYNTSYYKYRASNRLNGKRI